MSRFYLIEIQSEVPVIAATDCQSCFEEGKKSPWIIGIDTETDTGFCVASEYRDLIINHIKEH